MSLFDVTLTVGGDVISSFDISEIIIREEFTKARQFEISVLDEARASWILDEVVVIDYGFGSPKRLRGRLEGIDKRGALAILTGRDVSYETLDRPVDKEYTDTEVVAIMKDLIDTYAAGVLTYANAAASASTIGSIYPRRISMLDAFNKLIRYAESVDGDDFIWYLDHDKDLHTFAEGDVDNGRSLAWMIEIFDYRRIRDSWRAYDKVTVYGGLDTDGNATSGSSGAGSREKIVIDEFLATDLACSQRAAAELKKTAARDVYALTCILSSDGPTIGERVFVSLDPEEIEMGFIVYAVEDHLYSGVTVVEVGESVAGFTDTMIDEHVLDQYMQQIKPAAVLGVVADRTDFVNWVDLGLPGGWWVHDDALRGQVNPRPNYLEVVVFNSRYVEGTVVSGMFAGTLKKYFGGTFIFDLRFQDPYEGAGDGGEPHAGLTATRWTELWWDSVLIGYYPNRDQWLLVTATDEPGEYTDVDISGDANFEARHVYKIVWETPAQYPPDGRIRLYIDDVLKRTLTANIPNVPMSFAFGGVAYKLGARMRCGARLYSYSFSDSVA